MSYYPNAGDVTYLEFDDCHLSYQTYQTDGHADLWLVFFHAILPHPSELSQGMRFPDADAAVHWLRCRGMARRLARTGRFDPAVMDRFLAGDFSSLDKLWTHCPTDKVDEASV